MPPPGELVVVVPLGVEDGDLACGVEGHDADGKAVGVGFGGVFGTDCFEGGELGRSHFGGWRWELWCFGEPGKLLKEGKKFTGVIEG